MNDECDTANNANPRVYIGKSTTGLSHQSKHVKKIEMNTERIHSKPISVFVLFDRLMKQCDSRFTEQIFIDKLGVHEFCLYEATLLLRISLIACILYMYVR